MPENLNLEGIEPEVSVEGELSADEKLDLARKALENISLKMQRDEKFPGYDAFRRIMELVILAEDEDGVIDNWNTRALEWEKEFTDAEDDDAKEKVLADLKSMLEGAFDSAERKLTASS